MGPQVPLAEGSKSPEQRDGGVVDVGADRCCLLPHPTLWTLQADERATTLHHAVRRDVRHLHRHRWLLLPLTTEDQQEAPRTLASMNTNNETKRRVGLLCMKHVKPPGGCRTWRHVTRDAATTDSRCNCCQGNYLYFHH